jgi:lysophospholipase L1-like esterase
MHAFLQQIPAKQSVISGQHIRMDSKIGLVAAGAAAGAAATYVYACGTSDANSTAAPKPPPPPTEAVACDEAAQRVVCYGDSNTWGFDAFSPGAAMRRYGEQRWPRVLARHLGPGVDVVEEGLNGRTCIVDDPFMSDYDANGRRTLAPMLHSHKPIDVLVIMLGTNDLKKHLNLSPQLIARGAATLANDALRMDIWRSTPRVLLVCPVNIRQPPASCRFAYSFDGGAAKAPACAAFYRAEAETLGVAFLDANEATAIPDPRHGGDGIHLSAQNGADLGAAVAAKVREMLTPDAFRAHVLPGDEPLPVAGGKSPRVSQK